MGLFDFTKNFRTGATAARKAGDAASLQATEMGQVSLAEQQALKSEIGSIYQPTMQAGQQAFQGVTDFYSGNQQPIIDQAMNSPFMSQLVEGGENRIARNAQATGGFRSGTTQENFQNNYGEVLMNLVNQTLQGKQGIANAGFGAADAYATAGQNIIAGQGATRGQIAGVDIANAAQQANQAAGRTNMYSSIIGGAAQGGAAAFSDRRLKDNVVKIGEKNNLPWYTWEWNEAAKSLGLSGSDEGYIAQEVQVVRPDLVVDRDGYLTINYGGF